MVVCGQQCEESEHQVIPHVWPCLKRFTEQHWVNESGNIPHISGLDTLLFSSWIFDFHNKSIVLFSELKVLLLHYFSLTRVHDYPDVGDILARACWISSLPSLEAHLHAGRSVGVSSISPHVLCGFAEYNQLLGGVWDTGSIAPGYYTPL